VSSLKVYPSGRDAAGIYAFGVLPAYRGQGIGQETLTEVCLQLLAEGRTRIALEAETTNRRPIPCTAPAAL
jgi:ribosomal protein S18 acetylase RimI-like enzyme